MSDTNKIWKCDVCGYVHKGAAPPNLCPTCGVDSSQFSVFELPTAEPAPPPAGQTICTICGYVHDGPAPEVCPVCNAGRRHFKPLDTTTKLPKPTGEQLVIIGGGIAGLCAAESARQTDANIAITLVEDENELPYYRLNLTRLLANKIKEGALVIKPQEWFTNMNIALKHGKVDAIDTKRRTIRFDNGDALAYDKLILATGAHPFVPPFSGVIKPNVATFRTLSDLKKIETYIKPNAKAVCIGGGLLGLETAGALAMRGMDVTVIEGFDWLLPRQLPKEAGHILQAALLKKGIHIETGARVKQIAGDDLANGVTLENGKVLPADVVIISTGVRPNSYLARQCGLKTNQGVIVNDYLCTSDPHIYAAGDVAEHRGEVPGIWPTSYAQGTIAGANTAGKTHEYTGSTSLHRLKVLDTQLFSIGQIHPKDASCRVYTTKTDETFTQIISRDGIIQGAVLLGDTSAANQIQNAIESRKALQQLPELGQKLWMGH